MTEPTSVTNADLLHDKHVKVFLKNGAGCEGRVLYWSDDQAILVNDDTGNELYLYSVKENVVMVKVYKQKPSNTPFQKVHLPRPEEPPITVREYNESMQPYAEAVDYKAAVQASKIIDDGEPEYVREPNPDFRLKKLADLRALKAESLKEQARKRMKTFVPTHMTPGYYDSPDFTK